MKYDDEIKLIREFMDGITTASNFKNYIIEYRYIPMSITKLPFDIYIDDGLSYYNHNHPLWLFACIDNTLIPVTVSDNPQIMYGELNAEDFNKLRQFISANQVLLKKVADDQMDSSDFVMSINKQRDVVESLSSNKELLTEMARIRKDITGLPCDIYVDSGTIHSGHEDSPHIKFPPNNDCKISTDFVSMSLSPNPDFFPKDKPKYDKMVKGKLKKAIQQYIILHLEDFLLQFQGNISVDELKARLLSD